MFLPIIGMLVFGAIETANMIYLRQALKAAAYEVARSVTNVGGVQADAEARGYQALTARGITGGVIDVTPAVDINTVAGTAITVTVTAPADANADGPQWFYEGQTLKATVVMSKM